MILHTLINISTCFDLGILRQMTQVAIDFNKNCKVQDLSNVVKLQHCNNIFMFKDYIAEHFNDNTQEILIIKHVLDHRENAKELLSTKASTIISTDIDDFRMVKFVNWFYNTNEKIYLRSKKSEMESLDDKLLDFSVKKFYLKDLLDVKTNYLDTLDLTKSEKVKYLENINVELFFQYIFGIKNTAEAITFGSLKKGLEKATPFLIDIKRHIESLEECIFTIIVRNKKTTQRISRYFYHLGGICYENVSLNMGVETKTIDAFEKVRDISSFMMNPIKYTDKASTYLYKYEEIFNRYFNANISESILGQYLKTAKTDLYGRYANALEELKTFKFDSEPESNLKKDGVENRDDLDSRLENGAEVIQSIVSVTENPAKKVELESNLDSKKVELEVKPVAETEAVAEPVVEAVTEPVKETEPELEVVTEPVTEPLHTKITPEEVVLEPTQEFGPVTGEPVTKTEVEKPLEEKVESSKDDSKQDLEIDPVTGEPVNKTGLEKPLEQNTELSTEELELRQEIDSVTGEPVKEETKPKEDKSEENLEIGPVTGEPVKKTEAEKIVTPEVKSVEENTELKENELKPESEIDPVTGESVKKAETEKSVKPDGKLVKEENTEVEIDPATGKPITKTEVEENTKPEKIVESESNLENGVLKTDSEIDPATGKPVKKTDLPSDQNVSSEKTFVEGGDVSD